MQSGTHRAGGKLTSSLIKSTIVAALGGLLFGFDTAVIAGVTGPLTKLFHLTPASLGFTVAVALWGTMVGAMLAGIPGDKYGRRDSLRSLAVPFLLLRPGLRFRLELAFFRELPLRRRPRHQRLFCSGPHVYCRNRSRPLARQAGGLLSVQHRLRHPSRLLLQFRHRNPLARRGRVALEAGHFRCPGLSFLPFFLFSIPRSPRWLAKKGYIDEARQVLNQIGEEDAEQHLKQIIETIDQDRARAKQHLFSRKYRFPVMFAIVVAMFNQLAGINSILYYLNDIFTRAGFTIVSGDLQAVVICATNVLFTMLAMTVIDKLVRKKVLLIGSVGTCICLAIVSYLFYTRSHEHLLIWPLIAYIAFFAFSQGAVRAVEPDTKCSIRRLCTAHSNRLFRILKPS